jgi:hypothetical protein
MARLDKNAEFVDRRFEVPQMRRVNISAIDIRTDVDYATQFSRILAD